MKKKNKDISLTLINGPNDPQTREKIEQEKIAKKIIAIRKGRITKEQNKLKKLYSSVSKEKEHIVKKLIDRASFLLILSEDMEKEIKNGELLMLTINASQQFVKSHPLLKDHRDTVKSYQTVLKQLYDLTKNDSSSNDEDDELRKFLEQ